MHFRHPLFKADYSEEVFSIFHGDTLVDKTSLTKDLCIQYHLTLPAGCFMDSNVVDLKVVFSTFHLLSVVSGV